MDEKLLEKLKDEKFVKQMVTAKDEKEVKQIFAENGIKADEKNLEKLGEILSNIKFGMCELSEDEINNVSGGKLGPFGFLATKLNDALNGINLGEDAVNETLVLAFMATGVCLWEGGRYVVKKGKENQWFDKFKNSAISLKTKITGKNK